MQLFSELSRRRVIRGAGLYAVGAWIATEVSATVLPLLGVPEKYITGIVITLIVLFPVAMILVWIYDLGPAGLRRTPALSQPEEADKRPGMLFHMSLLVVAMVALGYGLFWLGSTRVLQSVPRNSVAVLPFENLSSSSEKDYFSDGISEEILNLLAQVDGLNVAARTSSFVYRDGSKDIRNIGSELGVQTVLEGSVRWAEDTNRVRVTAQLIDAESGYHLWSNNYDRDLQDIFAVQSEIAGAIVDVLRLKLGAEQTAWQPPTADMAAYDDYLKGRQLLSRRRAAEVRQSIDFFHRALASDPAFATAHAAIAVAYLTLPVLSDEPTEQLHQMAANSALQALALSPELAEAHAVQAKLKQFEGDWSRAQFGYFAATSMDPNDVTTRVWYSEFLRAAGKLSQAGAQSAQALDLDPDNPLTLASTATQAMIEGDSETCVEYARGAIELGFSSYVSVFEGLCLARLGRFEEASRALIPALDPLRESSGLRSFAAALQVSDSPKTAAQTALMQEEAWPNDPWAFWLSVVAGDADRVFAALPRMDSERGDWRFVILWLPEAAELRRDPRFLEFMTDSGVTDLWRNDYPDLCQPDDNGRLSCN
jgi:TolB-like protein/Flp pilus assembly protein TadD